MTVGYGLVAWRRTPAAPADGLSTTVGAVLEALVAIHAMDLGHLRTGTSVAVIGCGPIGLLLAEAALSSGATSVIVSDPQAHRREEALRRGARLAVSPEELRHRLPELEVDVAFEVAGNDDAVAQAARCRPAGRPRRPRRNPER